ncbi:phenylacetate--CoA ligase family protein, partial [bacterium]|nr:phenylacetate--CoA ligase family protein [bacterium]
HLIVEILPGKYFDEATLPEISKHVTDVMGDGVKIETKAVEAIPQQAGKMRRVISEIPKDNKS